MLNCSEEGIKGRYSKVKIFQSFVSKEHVISLKVSSNIFYTIFSSTHFAIHMELLHLRNENSTYIIFFQNFAQSSKFSLLNTEEEGIPSNEE